MSGLSALASYDLSDEDVDKMEDSGEGAHEQEEIKEEPKPEEPKKEIELHQREEIWEDIPPRHENEEEEEPEGGEDAIKDVEDLSIIHNESSDEAAAGGKSSEEENDDVSSLGSAMRIEPKLRSKRKSSENATDLAKKLRSASSDEVVIPPEPEGQCSASLQNKISRFLDRKAKYGEDLNLNIQARKDFRNPSIYEKLILYLGIEELGTNFPPEDYNPKVWRKAPAYDELARAQREDMSKREKEKKTKVEFVTGTVKKPQGATGSGSGDTGKKSKWDQQVNVLKVSAERSSSSKPTVISAVGTIKKTKS